MLLRPALVTICVLLSAMNFIQAETPRADAADSLPAWIWPAADRDTRGAALFRKEFAVTRDLRAARLECLTDFYAATIILNDKLVARLEPLSTRTTIDVAPLLKPGKNVINVSGMAVGGGPAALALTLDLRFEETTQSIRTDASWQSSFDGKPGNWRPAVALGRVSAELWTDPDRGLTLSTVDDYNQWKQALDENAKPEDTKFALLPGFQIERLRTAHKGEGSWIGMAFDERGRLLIGKEDKGILRLTLPKKKGAAIKVEIVNDTLKECRGLVCAHGCLYVSANSSMGTYRLRDTNGDDKFDEVKLLRRYEGSTGHGRNDLALGPDGKIYCIHGDSVQYPENVTDRTSPVAQPNKKLRQGFVVRTDRDGKDWEVVATGFRNPYGIAFNPDGDMFTYDADAEYDMGSPWYRPTRIHHILPGGDTGWRGVTKNWPPHYPDQPGMAPYVLTVGKGSPTSVRFGTGSQFPPRYRDAMFALDWAYGRILAVHLKPRGSTYAANVEVFLQGRPLNVTDLDIGPDGAMYIVTGGRKTQSSLFRVRYVGKPMKAAEPTAQEAARAAHAEKARAERRKLEALLGKQGKEVIDTAWPYLDSPDNALRHAARIVIEHQPVANWQERALQERQVRARLNAFLALVKACPDDVVEQVLARMTGMKIESLTAPDQRLALRIWALCLERIGAGNKNLTDRAAFRLNALYPTGNAELDKNLSLLLAKYSPPHFLAKSLAQLKKAQSQAERLHYLYVLRDARTGWTLERRGQYLEELIALQRFRGGEGMPAFIKQVTSAALAAVPASEREAFAAKLAEGSRPAAFPDLPKRDFVKDWKIEALADALPTASRRRNFERGQMMFAAAQCVRCHRMGGVGAAIGPDLTSVASRFSRRDLLASILTPSKVVAEQYRNVSIETTQGKVIVGQLVPGSDFRSSKLQVVPNPLEPAKIVEIAKQDVDLLVRVNISPMPQGLLNTLSQEEILDLLAFIEAAGNPEHRFFKP